MGYWWEKHEEVVITHAIGPGPKAKHKKYSFYGDFDWQQQRIHEIYQGSGRHITYLGGWHSHTEGGLMLSYKDKKALKKISQHSPARTPVPIMGIVYFNDGMCFNVWKYTQATKKSFLNTGKVVLMEVELFMENE